jgi:hypothetical protein
MSPWTRSTTKLYPGLAKSEVWRLWTDVNGWQRWHPDLDLCKLEGPFAKGNHFLLKPKGAPTFKIELTQVDEGRAFTDCTRFFGARMYDSHELEETPEGLRLTNTLTVEGPLAFLWVKLVAQNVAATVPAENDALAALARGQRA